MLQFKHEYLEVFSNQLETNESNGVELPQYNKLTAIKVEKIYDFENIENSIV